MQAMPDLSEILRLAQTPEGQKLIAMVQSSDSTALNSALSSAGKGDYEGAKAALSGLLTSPEAQELLRRLGERHG